MFIELNRTFHELSESGDNSDSEALLHFSGGQMLGWDDLIQKPRVVVLSEAGSGKTEEIRHIAQRLRSEGKAAFFVRLEHISQDFESAFEEGSYEEFLNWQASDNTAWLLLDSVDEARLRNPGDFETAIRKLARVVRAEKQRINILITGRTSAWRARTDLALCEKHLPYVQPTVVISNADEMATDMFQLELDKNFESTDSSAFKIVALDDLNSSQVEIFTKAKGVANAQAFLDAVERADAWLYTSRPLDLEELVEFWNNSGRIGSRLELMKNSIERRLKERDEDRAEARPLSEMKARQGAMLIAAASTLMHEPTIQVPDGSHNSKGIQVKSILDNWDDIECATLLSRPIFDEAIYGTVRFHHRSVREYLTAEWFASLLKNQTSRRSIEELFFRKQYGLVVIVPALRPILPWLAILDAKICRHLCNMAPEVLFEGGDPSQLPLEIRRQILNATCEQLASGVSSRSITDLSAVQRFASLDLASDIKKLIHRFIGNEDLLWFLLRMVWQGEISEALPEAKQIAITTSFSDTYTRVAAFRVIGLLGSDEDNLELRSAFQIEAEVLNRDLLATLLENAPASTQVIGWLFNCLQQIEELPNYHLDRLDDELCSFIARSSLESLPSIIEQGNMLLETQPVIEQECCEISVKYSWLMKPIALALERLVSTHDNRIFSSHCLAALRMVPILNAYRPIEQIGKELNLHQLVSEWPELNLALFWYLVEIKRVKFSREGKQLRDWWGVGLWHSYISFGLQDFELLLSEVQNRTLLDDKLIALSLTFNLYIRAERLPAQRRQLKAIVRGNVELSERLTKLLRPDPLSIEDKKWRKQQAEWERKALRNKTAQERNRDQWKEHVMANVELIRNPSFKELDAVSDTQYYLYNWMRQQTNDNTGRSNGNWPILASEFGLDAARAFRDGAVTYWRRNQPLLVSEGAATNSTHFSSLFGLTGLAIESIEIDDWPAGLNEADAELAFRYAMHELNGFPRWLPLIFHKFPDAISRMVLREINFELETEDENKDSYYVLQDVSGNGDWLWNEIAPHLLATLTISEPQNLRNLEYLLTVIQGSSCTDSQIALLASQKLNHLDKKAHYAYWFATWVGVAPEEAIPALENYLNAQQDGEERVLTASIFITQLLGGRRLGRSLVREAYRTPAFLKSLYLLMHRHIRRNEDIDRANGGVYSPGLRDNAQEARDQLFGLLKEIPGKETFVAIKEIALEHPDERSRPWFQFHAMKQAESDADSRPWLLGQVREFTEIQERTPSNHRDLFDLAVMRMNDLKDDLENGDSSIATVLRTIKDEVEVRKVIGNWCRDCARGRYSIPQEEELADAKRPDFRWHGVGFDAPLPMELKLADNWSGPDLFERLRVQLCGDYLRDNRSRFGVFLLVYRGEKTAWQLPINGVRVVFEEVVEALQDYWYDIFSDFPGVDDIRVIGIDLTKRNGVAI